MSIINAIFLGIIQGATEFLPVSSSGHLVLAHTIFGADGTADLAFDAILQLATALAVVVYFRRDLITMTHTFFRKLARLPVNEKEMNLIYAIVIGTIPGILLGLSLESLMETLFRNPLMVAGVLVAGSFLFVVAEWLVLSKPREESLGLKKGLYIGLFQSLALMPGMSRSGATISGGMLLGLSRTEAARFSFLLSIPIIVGAGLKKLLDLLTSSTPIDWLPLIVSASIAFFVGLFAIHFMLAFVRKHTLWPFVWYRLILAGLVVFFVLYA